MKTKEQIEARIKRLAEEAKELDRKAHAETSPAGKELHQMEAALTRHQAFALSWVINDN